jgi:hypothetical protein
MKKALIGLLICIMMLVTILPITAAADSTPIGPFGHTTVRGFAIPLGMSATGKITHLLALRLHFSTTTITGQNSFGVLRFRPIDIPTKVIGYRGHLYIFASFQGTLNI